jgi:hypothetical protein
MKAIPCLAISAALVLSFSVSAVQAQDARAMGRMQESAVKADVAILTTTTPHWDKRVGVAGIAPIVKNTEAYLRYKGLTVGNKENSRFWLNLNLDFAAMHATVIIMSLAEAGGGSVWQTDKLTGEAIPMQALFDTTPNPTSMDTLYSRMHAVIDEHLDGILMFRPVEDAPAPVTDKQAPTSATDAPAADLPSLLITSSPESAEIEVDGNFMGNTPAEMGLAAGQHVIVVSKKGYEPWQRKMTLAPGKASLSVELDKKAH